MIASVGCSISGRGRCRRERRAGRARSGPSCRLLCRRVGAAYPRPRRSHGDVRRRAPPARQHAGFTNGRRKGQALRHIGGGADRGSRGAGVCVVRRVPVVLGRPRGMSRPGRPGPGYERRGGGDPGRLLAASRRSTCRSRRPCSRRRRGARLRARALPRAAGPRAAPDPRPLRARGADRARRSPRSWRCSSSSPCGTDDDEATALARPGVPRRRGRVQVGLAVHLPVAARASSTARRPGRPATCTSRPGPRSRCRCARATSTHAFWIPDLRFKRDAWPRKTRALRPALPGGHAAGVGHCAQYCGLQHSDMVFFVDAMDRGALRALVARAGRAARERDASTPPFAPVRGLVGLAVGDRPQGRRRCARSAPRLRLLPRRRRPRAAHALPSWRSRGCRSPRAAATTSCSRCTARR